MWMKLKKTVTLNRLVWYDMASTNSILIGKFTINCPNWGKHLINRLNIRNNFDIVYN